MIWANVFHAYQPWGWDPAVLRRVTRESYAPFFGWLKSHPHVCVTVNLVGSLAEHLERLGERDLLATIKSLVHRGQVELMRTAMYHPILPLFPAPLVRRQIERQDAMTGRLFDDVPRGLFLPEMAYAPGLGRTIAEAGADWIVLDEIAAEGALGSAATSHAYRLTRAPVSVVFRNRIVSDFLFFSSGLDHPEEFWTRVGTDGRSSEGLVTAMDLENLGHHRPGLDRYWQTVVTDSRARTVTVSDFIAERSGEGVTTCDPLSSSWATLPENVRAGAPFPLWRDPENPIHKLQWQLTDMVVAECAREQTDDAGTLAVDRAIASDQYWWASATPWWDVAVIQSGANALVRALESLSPPSSTAAHARELRDHILALAREWHEGGRAERRRQSFFTRTGSRARMAGEEVR